MATSTGTAVANSLSQPGSTSGGYVQGPNYFPGWETQVLSLLKAPATASNIMFLAAWHEKDISGNNPPALNNPLDVTAYPPIAVTVGSQSINSAGVQSYSSQAQGAQSTAAWLQMPNYSAILSALKSGDAFKYQALNQGAISNALLKWSGGGYSSIGTISQDAISSALNDVTSEAGNAAGAAGSAFNQAAGHVPGVSQTESVVGGAAAAVTGAAKDAASVSSFLGDLTNPQIWIRIVEVVTGSLLVGIGLILIAKDFGSEAKSIKDTLGGVPYGNKAQDEASQLADAFSKGQTQGRVEQARRAGRQASNLGTNQGGPSETPRSTRARTRAERISRGVAKYDDVPIPF